MPDPTPYPPPPSEAVREAIEAGERYLAAQGFTWPAKPGTFLPAVVYCEFASSRDIAEWLRRHGHTVTRHATTDRGAHADTIDGIRVYRNGYIGTTPDSARNAAQ